MTPGTFTHVSPVVELDDLLVTLDECRVAAYLNLLGVERQRPTVEFMK